MKKDLENQIGSINEDLKNIYLPLEAVLILLGKRTAFRMALEFIDSLQQEQPEINIPSDGSGAMGTTPPRFKLDVKEQPVEGLEGAAENIYKTPFGTRAEDFKAGAEWMAQHIVGGRKCMKKKFLAIAERKKPKE